MSKQTAALTYRALVDQATQQLFDHSDSPRIDAEVLLQHVVAGTMAWLIAHGDAVASVDHVTAFSSLVDQRQQGQPIAYLVGYKEFWSLRLTVNQHVLVPRADTETLIEQALQLLTDKSAPALLDLGTGSGAIALALAKELPESEVTAVDASIDALKVAAENAAENRLDNVRFIRSDWYSGIENCQFDLIAANPPYVSANDPHLEEGDLRFEPIAALVAGQGGFADLEIIVEHAPRFLKLGGKLIVEHGHQQAGEVETLFRIFGFSAIALHKDLNGLPRCTSGSFSS